MRFAAILLSIAAFAQPAGAQDSPAATQAATKAAEVWLAQVDAGDYAGSWKEGAATFRGLVSQERWNEALRGARAPLGAVKSRTLARAQHTLKLPGAPEGEYVVIEYRTEFATRAGTETVVPMREADGSWKVSGYFVK
ncbi:DUF4019 domain-containing protein [Massilia sp. 9I]|uniref:DUF4019 domain-containing protein n=1 Tax=Massilia sp. 9I TaxID=2653152 RepID=UPI0012F04AFE|nr:DUF4019 domain-containing protein [Massilia sp. 9I]VXB91715.1 conserved exported hypothetical protein [Massilia sp. 9I]